MEGPATPTDPPEGQPPRYRRTIAWLTGAALLIRAAFLLLEPASRLVGDEQTWTDAAVALSDQARLSPFRNNRIFHPPLYCYFIACSYFVFETLTAAKWAQVLVSSLIVPAVGLVGVRAFGARAGVLAAGIVAIYPELIWFSVHFWAETLFMLFLWWAWERLLAAEAGGRWVVAAEAGLAWGLAVLTRETALYFTPFAAVWLALAPAKGRRRCGLVFLVVTLATVAPWTYRNWVRFHAFIPVSTAGGLNLYQGNAPLSRQEVYDRYYAVHGRVEQYRWARREGLQAILARQPWWAFEKLRDEMPKFWEADSLALIHIRREAYGRVYPRGPVHPKAAVTAAVVVIAPYLLVLVSFVVGLAALRLDRRRCLLLGFLVFYNALHVVTHGFARYRLPALPVVFLVAAWAWATWLEGRWPRLGIRRQALAVGLGVVCLAVLTPSFKKYGEEPAYDLGAPAPRTLASPE